MALITSTSGHHKLTFDDRPNARQRYQLNDVPVVGVTTFIKAGYPTSEGLVSWKIGRAAEFVADFFKEWRTSEDEFPSDKKITDVIKLSKSAWKKEAEQAAAIGTIVHDYAYYSSLKKDEEALEVLAKHEGTESWDKILNAVQKFDEWNKDNKDEIVHLEEIVASPTFQFGGKFDRLVRREGFLILTDYKTSNSFYPENFIQDAAYAIAINEWLGLKVDGYEVVRFGKEDGEPEVRIFTDKNDIRIFKEAALRCLETYNFVRKWE